jgi:glycosyltransferase involved in cell wall biosynthesis/GT2 family glycosyltransferase
LAPDRPSISVVVPFAGTSREARALLDALELLSLRERDELIVVDNTAEGVARRAGARSSASFIEATAERSSYYARNVGAEAARNGWLLFIDSDCRPSPDLLDELLGEPTGERVGIVAGGVVSAPEQQELAARYARSRGHISERWHIERARPYPAGVTANLLIRRLTWDSLGGFQEGIRSGGDVEFCFRAQAAGWELLHRPLARVEHVHPVTLRPALRKAARHAAGRVWVNRRFPGAYERPRLGRELTRALAGSIGWALSGQLERGSFKALDGIRTCAETWGYLAGDNRAERPRSGGGRQASAPTTGDALVVFADAFPVASETFVYNEVRALGELGWQVRVESSARPARPEREVARELAVSYLEDEPMIGKLGALAGVVGRHPWRCLRDVRVRSRWQREEEVWPLASIAPAARRLVRGGRPHVHAHFAAGAALHALRCGEIEDVRYSLTAHAYDIFQKPRNLPEKVRRASFTTAECTYTAEHLRRLVPERDRSRVHRIPTGVRTDLFRRTTPPPGDGTVVAIGRLIEKKGFAHLVEAAAQIGSGRGLERVVIAGDGPLRTEIESWIERLGVAGTVELRGNVWGRQPVRDLLENADLLCVPSVLARDGDRDALPVVIYEALAMEVPVVASEIAGLPEAVKPGWGRLAPPGDPAALAEAIAELLALSASERAEMGKAGRAFVVEHCDQRDATARLAELIKAAADGE